MKKELTVLSIGLGIIIGVIMTMANVYLGLYAGMTVSASIPAAVISMGIFSLMRKKSVLESNIVQTMASAGESLAAGIIFTLPALVIIGSWKNFEFWPTVLIAICGGLLGVLFMIPLRKALIEDEEELIYPEGVACATVLSSAGEQDSGGFFTIIKGLALGGIFKFFSSGLKLLIGSVEKAFMAGKSVVFTGLDVSPALLAVGYIVGLNVSILVFIGGAIGWFIEMPLLGTPAEYAELAPLDLAWTLWSKKVRYLGVGAMIVGGLWSIVSVRKGIKAGVGALINKKSGAGNKDIGMAAISGIFISCFLLMLYLYNSFIGSFGMSLFTALIMIVCCFLFVAVSSYIVGLVGSSNNPVSGMTISALLGTSVLFLLFGFKGDSAILATLGVAAVVCCAACTAGDCSQDLKTGSLLKATPRSQQIAQIIGVIIPAFTIPFTLNLLHEGYVIGEGLKAPQATLFASITEALFSDGTLPYNMLYWGAGLGVLILLIDHFIFKPKGGFRLHLMPIAVGIYLPVTLAIPMLVGGIIKYIVEKKSKARSEAEDKGILLSSGLIAGEALMGVIIAAFVAGGISLSPSFIGEMGHGLKELLSIGAFFLVSIYLYRTSR